MKFLIISPIFLLLILLKELDAYSIHQLSPSLRKEQSTTLTRSSTSNYAIIYGAEGEGVWEEDSTFTLSSTTSSSHLIESLDLEMDLLIRLASAFAPSPHNHLHPKDIISANLVNLTPSGADIAATIATTENQNNAGCVQILVPVTFPRPCYDHPDDETAACLVENFQILDLEACEKIQLSEYTQDYADQLERQQNVLQSLREEPLAIDLPNWWTYAELNQKLEEECSEMKYLLNENDFAADINSLFQNNFQGEDIQVIKTCVAAVGPSGIFLRAYVERQSNDEKEEKDVYFIANLVLEFDKRATSSDELRSNVLDMVEVPEESSIQEESEEEKAEEEEEETNLQYTFQRQLLETRLQIDYAASQRQKKKEKEVFQRRLLEARLQYEQIQLQSTRERVLQIGIKQPKSVKDEARLAEKYAKIEDIGERAFAILKDLELI